MADEKIIEVKNLTKNYKNLTAVKNLDLNVFRGDVFGFLGPNGAGKSTTIRMLLSLIEPTSGDIKIFGNSLKRDRKNILKNIGAIVEKPDFYQYLTAYKNLEILGKISGSDISKKQIFEMLELVGLEKRFDSKVKTFSHGMKQRLGIAQALLHDPELIILDEPTTGLDPQGMKEIRELIISLSSEKGKTIFLSSHILREVELIANRMIIINRGETKVEGKVEELLDAEKLEVSFNIKENEQAENALKESRLRDHYKKGGNGIFLFRISQDEIAGINKFFVENNFSVEAIVPKRSLEEYFLKITEGSGE